MPRKPVPSYSWDFETIVNPDETRVWLWGSVKLDNENFKWGTTIDSFMEHASEESCVGYFHNMKFDIQFIFYWLFHHGYRHTSQRNPESGEFTTLISDMGMFYSCQIGFKNGKTCTIYDSFKIIPLGVAKIPKAFGLDLKKLEIEYEGDRPLNYVPTEKEVAYVKNDVLIVARALRYMKEQGQNKMTCASNALADFKSRYDKKTYEKMFPQLPLSVDKDCRKAYKGGWSYLNPKYKDLRLGVGQVYDVNSMYPWAMKYCLLPCYEPVYFEGEYVEDSNYPLYIISCSAKFKLKKNKYPSIQIKGSFRFNETEYIIDSGEEPALLTLTSVDLKLLFENYDVEEIEYFGGYKFQARHGIFEEYIDYWYNEKTEAKRKENKGAEFLAKRMLNSLYGKFGSNPIKRSKFPYLEKTKDLICYSPMAEEITKGGYVPIAAFITSYCRDKIIRAANSCGDRFVYADTDSIHIIGEEIPDIEIDKYKLGAFKCENKFQEAMFHRSKCYIESVDGELEKKCAGLPEKARELFNFDTMKVGSVFKGKLRPKNVKGGVVLVETDFTIK